MKKSNLIKKYTFPYWICCVFFAVIAFTSISSAQITQNPIPQPIEKSKLSVGLEEVVKIPDSGSDKDGNKPPRLNLLIPPGDGSERLFVNDMRGRLYVIVDRTAIVYMDVKSLVGKGFRDQSGQQGLSYFAFHPEFVKNGIFYTVTSEDKDTGMPDFPVTKPIFNSKGKRIESSHHDVIREWKATNPSANMFSGTMREILRIEEPYPDHNTGQLAFNPNAKPGDADYGMLYIAVADGGSDGFPVSDTDPLDNGQDLGTPLGKILRIQPLGNNSANGKYSIPADNPFVDDGDPKTLGEIWAYGLRNPHRFSWDSGGDGKMLIVDTGQAFIEEVNLGKKGANYGWGEREGIWVVDENNENVVYELPENDRNFNYTYPVAQYDHDKPLNWSGFYAVAIAGGFVYRGTAIPELVGQYIFADFCNDGRFFHVPVDELVEGKQATIQELRLFEGKKERSFLEMVGHNRTDVRFGIDEAGELYVTSKQDGKVRKIVPSPESLNSQSVYKNNFHWLVPPKSESPIVQITPTLLQVRPSVGVSEKNSYKIGADTSVIAVAAVKDGVAMIEKATRQDGEYPDGAVGGAGFPVEVYNNGDAKENYAELELLSPLHLLKKGDRYQHTVRWSLHQLSSSDINATTTRDSVEKLLQQHR